MCIRGEGMLRGGRRGERMMCSRGDSCARWSTEMDAQARTLLQRTWQKVYPSRAITVYICKNNQRGCLILESRFVQGEWTSPKPSVRAAISERFEKFADRLGKSTREVCVGLCEAGRRSLRNPVDRAAQRRLDHEAHAPGDGNAVRAPLVC